MREVGRRLAPAQPHHDLQAPPGGAGQRWLTVQYIEDDIREDRPAHAVAGGGPGSCLARHLRLGHLSLVCEALSDVGPPVRSVSLHTARLVYLAYDNIPSSDSRERLVSKS